MPLTEAGFVHDDGSPNHHSLINYGPTINVIISQFTDDGSEPDQTKAVHALIDTGASDSCIDNQIAVDLGLPVVDVSMISGVGGVKEHLVYMAHVYIPNLERYQYGRFAGVDLIAGGQPHGALLGRTFLQGVIMIYDGIRAQVTLASPKVL